MKDSPSYLPISIRNLINAVGVETERIEFKRSWSEQTGDQVIRTIAAFANDYHNLNGGYIVIGVEEKAGIPQLPPVGIAETEVDLAQKWVRGNCNRIDPEIQPVIAVEKIDQVLVLVVWVPGSDRRPHRAPRSRNDTQRVYWVRIGSETVDAERSGLLPQLFELTARVPFDVRRAQNAGLEDLREQKVREFLRDVESELIHQSDAPSMYRALQIVQRVNSHEVPLNVGLLFFSEDAGKWFRGARIEVVHFGDDFGGDVLDERVFQGGIHEQLRSCLTWLQSFSTEHIEKGRGSHTHGWVSYPIPALREALVNAVYHRGYDGVVEPIKVYLYSDRMEIISYPGPVPGIDHEDLMADKPVPPVPARNRRIGEFLKELKLAEMRGTGIPKIKRSMFENGSPEPQFEFDEARSYTRVILPAHPEYTAADAVRRATQKRIEGDKPGALAILENAWAKNHQSATLAAELIRSYDQIDRISQAEDVWVAFRENGAVQHRPAVVNVFADVLERRNRHDQAAELLDSLPDIMSVQDEVDTAVMARRLRREEAAHRHFSRVEDDIQEDPRALLEYAQCKIRLAQKAIGSNARSKRQTNQQMLKGARRLLERIVQMDADPRRHAWAWRELARVRRWLKHPREDVRQAFEKAIQLDPSETRFRDELSDFERRNRAKQ